MASEKSQGCSENPASNVDRFMVEAASFRIVRGVQFRAGGNDE